VPCPIFPPCFPNKKQLEAGIGVHTCNLSCSGGRDWQGSSLTHKLDLIVHICNPSKKGDIGKRISVLDQPRQKERDSF
jgi:hypothetical protein